MPTCVCVQQARPRAPVQHRRQLLSQVVCVAHPRVHAECARGREGVRRVAHQESPALPRTGAENKTGGFGEEGIQRVWCPCEECLQAAQCIKAKSGPCKKLLLSTSHYLLVGVGHAARHRPWPHCAHLQPDQTYRCEFQQASVVLGNQMRWRQHALMQTKPTANTCQLASNSRSGRFATWRTISVQR